MSSSDLSLLVDEGDDSKTAYDSPIMHARRKRILAEARALIAEKGYENFNIRELASRANVAQRTLYNAFGSKDLLVATAVQQSHADFHQNLVYEHPAETLTGRLERLVKVRKRELQIKNYTVAIMHIYNTVTSESVIRKQFRELPRASLKPLVTAISRMSFFAPGVTAEQFTERAITFNYAALSDWCNGTVSDEDMVKDAVETFLIVLVGMTRSAIRMEGRVWLKDVRSDGPLWKALDSEEGPVSAR